MEDSIPALVMGGLLIGIGLVSVCFLWKQKQSDHSGDEHAQRHSQRQIRRRLQVSAMVILVGILIPLGDLLPLFRQAPVAFTIFWTAVMLLAGWIGLLGIADFASSRAYHSRARRRLKQQQAELEAELLRLRGSRGSRWHSDE